MYQSIEKCGTDGGFRLKLPVIFGCGNFSFGSDHVKLNFDLIASIALCTAFFAALIGVVIAFLIAFQTDVAVDFMLLNSKW